MARAAQDLQRVGQQIRDGVERFHRAPRAPRQIHDDRAAANACDSTIWSPRFSFSCGCLASLICDKRDVHEGGERALYAVLSGKMEVVKLFDGIERTDDPWGDLLEGSGRSR